MPNWCMNTLSITGPRNVLKAFKLKAVVKVDGRNKFDFSFGSFIRVPEEFSDIHVGGNIIDGKHVTSWRVANGKDIALSDKEISDFTAKYGAANAYDFNCRMLGVKWDVAGDDDGSTPDALRYGFESAWAQPEDGVRNLSAMYPELEFTLEFDEPGQNFGGRVVYCNGNCTDSEYGDSPTNIADMDLNMHERGER